MLYYVDCDEYNDADAAAAVVDNDVDNDNAAHSSAGLYLYLFITNTPPPCHVTSSYHVVDLKRQNCLKVGTDKPKLKAKMQAVLDDDVRKRLLEKPRFELAAKGVFRLGRCSTVNP